MGIFPPGDEKQQIRIRHFLIASASYIIWLTFAWLLELTSTKSLVSLEWLKILTATVVFVQLATFIVIRTGLNKRFKEPSLTLFQVSCAIIVASFFTFNSQQFRGTMLLAYVIILSFGAYQLSQKHMWYLVALSGVIFGGIIYHDSINNIADFDFEHNVVLLAILIVMLSWVAILGGYLRGLRIKVKQTLDDLKERNTEIKKQRDQITEQHTEIEKKNAELKVALERLGDLAAKDELTGLYNRRQFMHSLTSLAYKSEPELIGFAVCLVDIDHFKEINDTYGHQAGDYVLKQFATLIRNCMRSNDVIARYGGEEFVILIPQANKESSIECCERLRKGFAEARYPKISEKLRTNLSVGITHFHLGERIEETLSRADKALYKAKEEGRDRVVYIAPPN